MAKKCEISGTGVMSGNNVSHANNRTRRRFLPNLQVVSLLSEEAVLAKIIDAAPKKKNGTLYAKRVTQVASLFCMEKDASMYVLCAVAKDDSTLVMEIRTIVTSDLEKAESDVITEYNLFR